MLMLPPVAKSPLNSVWRCALVITALVAYFGPPEHALAQCDTPRLAPAKNVRSGIMFNCFVQTRFHDLSSPFATFFRSEPSRLERLRPVFNRPPSPTDSSLLALPYLKRACKSWSSINRHALIIPGSFGCRSLILTNEWQTSAAACGTTPVV